jgi:glycosyltransferase involved in cell wall biosynthesis
VVIPTLNEARNLPHVLPRLPDDVSEVIIVDGRSTDGTPEVALALRPDVRIVRERRRGKGSALEHGFRAATGDIIVMLDADGSADPAEIPRFVEALEGGADFAKGSRNLAGGGSTDITRLRSWGNRALTAVVNMLYGTRYTDLCYGYNAVWARCLPHIDFHCRGFEVETLINIRVAKSALRVREVPSLEHPRIHGVSNLNAASDGWRVLRTIVAERFHRSGRVSPGVGRDVPRVPSGRTVDD